MPKPGYVFDAGALIKLEGNDRAMRLRVEEALKHGAPIVIPAGVVAQVWRGSPQQHALGVLLRDDRITVVDLDKHFAMTIGRHISKCGHPDVIDVSVVICALSQDLAVVTSDPDDMRKVHPKIRVIEC